MKKAVFLFALFAILSHSAFARTQGITGGGAVGVPAELIMGVLAEENGGSGVTSMDDAVVTPSSTADEGTLSRHLYEAGSGGGGGVSEAAFDTLLGASGTDTGLMSRLSTGSYELSSDPLAVNLGGTGASTSDAALDSLLGLSGTSAGTITRAEDGSYGVASTVLGFRNIIINGAMDVSNVNEDSAVTLTAGSAFSYVLDQFYAKATGADVEGQRVSGDPPDKYKYQFTGASGVTGIYFGQPIESSYIHYLAGSEVTLSARVSNSLLTEVTWTVYYGSADDTFTSRIQIATGTWTVSATPSIQSATLTLPALAARGIEVELNVGAQTSGTFDVSEVQLEAGGVASEFERIPLSITASLAARYFEIGSSMVIGTATTTGDNIGISVRYRQDKRVPPAVIQTNSGTPTNTNTTPNNTYLAIDHFVTYRPTISSGNAQYAETWTSDARITP